MLTKQPGKKNKLKMRDTVQIKQKEFNTILRWIPTAFTTSCSEYGTVIPEHHFVEVHSLLDHTLRKVTPVGRVMGYGSEVEEQKDLLFVHVEFKSKFGKWAAFFDERDLKKLKAD